MYHHTIYKLCPTCNRRVHSEFGDCFICKAKAVFQQIPIDNKDSRTKNKQLANKLLNQEGR